jgi:integrase
VTKKLLTDKLIRDLPAPERGMNIVRDSRVQGLGVRVLPSGTRAFVLDYTIAGRRRIFTIGKFPEWQIGGAREQARKLKAQIRYDEVDPAADLKSARDAPTVADLCKRFRKEHLPKLRASTRGDYERMIDKDVVPELGSRKVADVRFEDIDKLHRTITERGSPAAANFCLALCSKMFNFAVRLRMIDRNPVKGVERNPAQPRNRYLSTAEIASLTKALAKHPDQDMADLFRLLLFTGARRGETQAAQWDQLNLKDAIWIKPSQATKQAREHRIPLAAPACALLAKRRAKADAELKRLGREIAKAKPGDRPALEEWRRRVQTWVFPARDGETGHLVEIKRAWSTLCKAAGIVTREEIIDEETGEKKVIEHHAARIHDLRHTAASVLASSGASLPLIGQLLGHTQIATTQRYSHLFDDAQRAAAERLGAIIVGGPSAEVFDLQERRKRR